MFETILSITLHCNMLSPADALQHECINGGFPYEVPYDKALCISQMFLVNKYRENPLRYDGDQHTMYFQIMGMSIPAHNPEVKFFPPIRKDPGTVLQAWIQNGMAEDQWVYGYIGGYLIPAEQDCLVFNGR